MKIKLIWDFKGSNDLQVAIIILSTLLNSSKKKHSFFEMGETSLSEFHQIAYVVIKKRM